MARLSQILGGGLPSRKPTWSRHEELLGLPELEELQGLLVEQAAHALLTRLSDPTAGPMDEAVNRIWTGLGIEQDHFTDFTFRRDPEQELLLIAANLAANPARQLTWADLQADIDAKARAGHRAAGEIGDLAEYLTRLDRAHHVRYRGALSYASPEQELAASLAGYLRAREAHGLFSDTRMDATPESLGCALYVTYAAKAVLDAVDGARKLTGRLFGGPAARAANARAGLDAMVGRYSGLPLQPHARLGPRRRG